VIIKISIAQDKQKGENKSAEEGENLAHFWVVKRMVKN
jgi:hypothetical protein